MLCESIGLLDHYVLKEVYNCGWVRAGDDTGGAQPVGSTRRPPTPVKPASKIRPTSPKSPVQGNGSYESVEGSEEEDHLLPNDEGGTNYTEEQDEEEDIKNHTLAVDGERNGGSEMVSLHFLGGVTWGSSLSIISRAVCISVRFILVFVVV